MVSPYLEDTYKLWGGGRSGVSVSGVHGAVFGWAPPHSLASTTDFTTVTSVSLQRKPYKCIHTWVPMQTPVVNSSRLKIFPVTYECSEPSSDALPRIAVYVTCLSAVSASMTVSS